MRTALVAGLLTFGFLGDPGAKAQRPAASSARSPEFEAASIRPSNPGATGIEINSTNGRYVASNVPVIYYIASAYDVETFEITGPSWIASARYDVLAKVPDDVALHRKPDDDERMLQQLLADRFRLVVHREPKEVPVYALVVARGGSKLEPAKPHEGSRGTGGRRGQMHGTEVSTAEIGQTLSRVPGRPVLDQTHIEGRYDFQLTWNPDDTQPADLNGTTTLPDSGPSIFTAVEEQLGLKLEATKGTIGGIVVDRVERPSEN